MTFLQELDTHLKSRATLINVNSTEEQRATELIEEVCTASNRRMITWDIATGFLPINNDDWQEGPANPEEGPDPVNCLSYITDTIFCEDKDLAKQYAIGKFVFVLKDFSPYLEGSERVKRYLKNLAIRFRYTFNAIILLSAHNEIQPELSDLTVSLNLDLPDQYDLHQILANVVNRQGIDRTELTEAGQQDIVNSTKGLTSNQALRAISKVVTEQNGKIADENAYDIALTKKAITQQNPALEFIETQEVAIGGLGNLKHWLNLKGLAFSDEAKAYGLETPNGVGLVGLPGTGKSLTAKLVAQLYKMPLIRLDVGALFGSLVGQSEGQTREALKVIEAMAPCVLWIDEIEKAFAGGSMDGGTSSRVFGTILTWMAEQQSTVFVVATANNISQLPPELFRSGRFDDIFFLDLPSGEERQEIFKVHIEKRGREARNFDLVALSETSQGMVGAEIEQAVKNGMFLGFSKKEELNTSHIIEALGDIIPLSVSNQEVITHLRSWVTEGRAKPAGKSETFENKKGTKKQAKKLGQFGESADGFELEIN